MKIYIRGSKSASYVYGKGVKVLTKKILIDSKKLEDISRGEVGYFRYGFEYIQREHNDIKVSVAPIDYLTDLENHQRINLLADAYRNYSIFRINHHIYRVPLNTSDYAKIAFYRPYNYLYKLKLGMIYQWNLERYKVYVNI